MRCASQSALRDGRARVRTLLDEYEQLDRAFPNWQRTCCTEEFSEWLAARPPGIRALADSPRAVDAIELLRDYQAFVRTRDDEGVFILRVPKRCINDMVQRHMLENLKRAKQARSADIVLRINGEDVRVEADWLKYVEVVS